MATIGETMIIGLVGMGVRIEKNDLDQNRIYISIPEYSVDYEESSRIQNPETFAKRVKAVIREIIGNDDLRVLYKVRKGEHWTREQGVEDAKELLGAICKRR